MTLRIGCTSCVTSMLLCLALCSPDARSAAAAAQGAGGVPVLVRIEGLALGNRLHLRREAIDVVATIDDDYALGDAAPGSALAIEVVEQPHGQRCAVSALASPTVTVDAAPAFVRCLHHVAPRVSVPATAPDDALAWWNGGAGLRAFAYPGLPYESRPGVIGGQFPYEFRLLGVRHDGVPIDASAVQLDFRRGTLRFTPAGEGIYAFDVEVRDSAAIVKVLRDERVVDARADAFVFVAPDGIDAPARGSLAQPLQSIPYALTRGTSQQIVMLRRGVYPGRFDLVDGRARQVIAYPDEIAVIDLQSSGAIDVRFDQAPAARLEGVEIRNVRQYGVVSDPSRPGAVFRQVRFRDGIVANAGENPAFLHGWGDGPALTRHRLLVQDSDFGAYPGGYATTLFDAGDSLFENNRVRLGASRNGLHDKDNAQRNVYRENYIAYAAGFANDQGIQVSAQSNSERVHIHHNLFVNSGVLLGGQCLLPDCHMREHDVHHNTLAGGSVVLRWGVFNAGSRDTRVSHNLLRPSATPYAWASCLGTVPAEFASQFVARANRLETAGALAMRDTECGGSPMNIAWAAWRDVYGLDTSASGSVLSAVSDLSGEGAATRLPVGDPRLASLGHRYPLPVPLDGALFGDGFE